MVKQELEEIQRLLQTLDQILGPEGCPLDHQQTTLTMRDGVLEEMYELIEAVDEGDPKKIQEELGDVLALVLYYGRLVEKEGKGTLVGAARGIREKMVRRHPHVFAEKNPSITPEEVIAQWKVIKQQEVEMGLRDPKAKNNLPKTLPALSQAVRFFWEKGTVEQEGEDPESRAGYQLLHTAKQVHERGIDPELALRKVLKEVTTTPIPAALAPADS